MGHTRFVGPNGVVRDSRGRRISMPRAAGSARAGCSPTRSTDKPATMAPRVSLSRGAPPAAHASQGSGRSRSAARLQRREAARRRHPPPLPAGARSGRQTRAGRDDDDAQGADGRDGRDSRARGGGGRAERSEQARAGAGARGEGGGLARGGVGWGGGNGTEEAAHVGERRAVGGGRRPCRRPEVGWG